MNLTLKNLSDSSSLSAGSDFYSSDILFDNLRIIIADKHQKDVTLRDSWGNKDWCKCGS